jgi:hypothetical protein
MTWLLAQENQAHGKNLSNVTVPHTSIMKCSGIEPRVQVYDKIWHDTCSEAKTVI